MRQMTSKHDNRFVKSTLNDKTVSHQKHCNVIAVTTGLRCYYETRLLLTRMRRATDVNQ